MAEQCSAALLLLLLLSASSLMLAAAAGAATVVPPAPLRPPGSSDTDQAAQLDARIVRELNASAVAMRELAGLLPAERTVGRSLHLCLLQDPDMFCAWLTQSAASVHQVTCFNELHHTCNRVSSKNRGRHTQCRPSCAPCRRSGCPADASCTYKCYCTCDYVRGSNSSLTQAPAYYPCSQLCSGDAKCPNEADESPATCDEYAASAPNFLFYVVVLGCIGGVGALCSLPFVLPKVRKYCCRGPVDEHHRHQHEHQHQQRQQRPAAVPSALTRVPVPPTAPAPVAAVAAEAPDADDADGSAEATAFLAPTAGASAKA